ncbi:MAG TPA: hypothetical protein DCS82_01260 [Rhodospirillaceae bacterium]|nr:hypothetical protein [Rhodospirillaceae bacterium]HAA93108.1 hypothetical protein [Rhodospirillaceae bacterium]HAT34318.1 hypothetical protein [Rhodospirillaceae bacterium]
MELTTQPLAENFGLEVLDVNLADIDDATFEAVRALWQKEPLILFRRQNPTNEEFIEFCRRFGTLDIVIGQNEPDEHYPELLFISNLYLQDGSEIGGLGSGELVWHTDQIYRDKPASGSIFYGVEMPSGIAATSFCNMSLAYKTLPQSMKDRLEGKRAICRYSTRFPLASYALENSSNAPRARFNEEYFKKVEERTPEVVHDMVLEDVKTGEKTIYVSPNHTSEIEGLDEEAGRDLIDAVLDHALQDTFIYSHNWRNGDVLFWDNARLLHRRDAFDPGQPRYAKRTTIFLDPDFFLVPEPELPLPDHLPNRD